MFKLFLKNIKFDYLYPIDCFNKWTVEISIGDSMNGVLQSNIGELISLKVGVSANGIISVGDEGGEFVSLDILGCNCSVWSTGTIETWIYT